MRKGSKMKLRRLFAHENAGFLRCELTQAQAAGRHVLGVSRGKGAFTTQRALASNAQACTPRRKLSASRSGILDRSLHTRERAGAPCRQSRTRRKRARNVTQPATQRPCAHAKRKNSLPPEAGVWPGPCTQESALGVPYYGL